MSRATAFLFLASVALIAQLGPVRANQTVEEIQGDGTLCSATIGTTFEVYCDPIKNWTSESQQVQAPPDAVSVTFTLTWTPQSDADRTLEVVGHDPLNGTKGNGTSPLTFTFSGAEVAGANVVAYIHTDFACGYGLNCRVPPVTYAINQPYHSTWTIVRSSP